MFELDVIEKDGEQWVDARELANVLKINVSGGNFSKWFNKNVISIGFDPEIDFGYYSTQTNGRPRADYHLSMDTAKHVCMMSRTEVGKKIRNYFIKIHDSYISGQLIESNEQHQTLVESTQAENVVLKKELDKRDKMINQAIDCLKQVAPTDPIGTKSKVNGRGRTKLVKSYYVSEKKDNPNQLVLGFDFDYEPVKLEKPSV